MAETGCGDHVGPDSVGMTVLAWLRKRRPKLSWSGCRRLLASRQVRVNGTVEVHEARRLKLTDVVSCDDVPTAPPRPELIRIVHCDDDLVVVEKPTDLVTTRRPEEQHWPAAKKRLAPTLDELVAEAIADRRTTSRPRQRTARSSPPLFRVQRLDRQTSGLVVFAWTEEAAKGLIRQFQEHTVERTYLAVVRGSPESQTISIPLVRDRGDGLRGPSRDGRGGQPAVTHVRRLATADGLSLVECRLETGRTHQIRIHLCELGTPVCGEPVYRHRLGETASPDTSGAPRLALHAARLGFRHPRSGERLTFTSPWPDDLAAWIKRTCPALLHSSHLGPRDERRHV